MIYIIGCSLQLIREVFSRLPFVVVVDTNLPRFEALAPHFYALTRVVIRVSSAFIFQTFRSAISVFVNRSSFKNVLNLRKAYIFKSLLKVYYRSVFNESSKAFILLKCAESLHPDRSPCIIDGLLTLSKILLWTGSTRTASPGRINSDRIKK